MPLFEKGTPGGACNRTDCDNAGLFTHAHNRMRYCQECAVKIEQHAFSGSQPTCLFIEIQNMWRQARLNRANKKGGVMSPRDQVAETNYQLFAKKS